jgi:hypothetical protein
LNPLTIHQKISFKNKLKQFGERIIEQRIAATKALINDAQEAANSEEKSTVGDKYETARAMGQLDTEMHSRQLAQHLTDLALLHDVKTDAKYDAAVIGSCIECQNMVFFIATGLGKQTVDGKMVIFLSPHAPLAKLLHHKKAGEDFLFNQVQTKILDVY